MSEERNKPFHRNVPVKLTDEEYVRLAKTMSREQNDMANLEGRMKEVAADFKAKIAQKEATVRAMSIMVSNGYEYREVLCMYEYRPKDGRKDVVRLDTLEIIGTEQMAKKDYQEELALNTAPEGPVSDPQPGPQAEVIDPVKRDCVDPAKPLAPVVDIGKEKGEKKK